jgi:hypothetical protein
MNTKSFETLEGTILASCIKEKGLSAEVQQKWYDVILENKDLFTNDDFEGIYSTVNSLAIDEIDDDIIHATACTIAYDNNVDIVYDDSCTCFLMNWVLKNTNVSPSAVKIRPAGRFLF